MNIFGYSQTRKPRLIIGSDFEPVSIELSLNMSSSIRKKMQKDTKIKYPDIFLTCFDIQTLSICFFDLRTFEFASISEVRIPGYHCTYIQQVFSNGNQTLFCCNHYSMALNVNILTVSCINGNCLNYPYKINCYSAITLNSVHFLIKRLTFF